MATSKELITNLVYDCLDELNDLLMRDTPLLKSPGSVLIGDGGLDSLGLVNFIGLVEESLESRLRCTVVLADLEGPFTTVGELVDILHRQLAQ